MGVGQTSRYGSVLPDTSVKGWPLGQDQSSLVKCFHQRDL